MAQGENARLRQHVLDLRRAARACGCDLNTSEALSAAAFPDLEAALRGPAKVASRPPDGAPGGTLGGNVSASEGIPGASGGTLGEKTVGGNNEHPGDGSGAGAAGSQGAGIPGGETGGGTGNATARGAAAAGTLAGGEVEGHGGRTDHRAERRHACAPAARKDIVQPCLTLPLCKSESQTFGLYGHSTGARAPVWTLAKTYIL